MPSSFNTHQLRTDARSCAWAAAARAREGDIICPCPGFAGSSTDAATARRHRVGAGCRWHQLKHRTSTDRRGRGPRRATRPRSRSAVAAVAAAGIAASPTTARRRRPRQTPEREAAAAGAGREAQRGREEARRERAADASAAASNRAAASRRAARRSRPRSASCSSRSTSPRSASPSSRTTASPRSTSSGPERRSIAGNIYKGVVDNVLPGNGGRVRRDRPREERLPLRRRDRRPRARGPPAARPPDHRPDQPRRGGPRPGGQGSDEDEGRAADDRDLAPRPLRRLRPARRGPRRLAPARGRRAQPPARHPQGDRPQAGRRDRPHRGRGRVRGGRRARPRLPDEALEADPGAGEGVEGADARLRGGRAAAARHPRPLHRRLRAGARRRRPDAQAHPGLPEEDLAAHGRAGLALPRARRRCSRPTASTPRSARRSRAASTCPRAAT